jgi:hypothetical protein
MANDKMIRVYLTNVQTLGARCGWGEGLTREDAIADAKALVEQIDPDAWYDRSGTVCFRGGMNC